MVTSDPQAQGALFERVLSELFERLIERDLGLELLENRIQGSGLQGGFDVRVRWRTANGHVARWHIECKSQTSSLKPDEVLPKLDQIVGSRHRLDVWCLACARAEPTNDTDQLLVSKGHAPEVPFGIVVLSPLTGFIRKLFECHPDLHERLYAEPAPAVEDAERRRRVVSFGHALEDATRHGYDKLLPKPWTLLGARSSESAAVTAEDEIAYFKGLRSRDPLAAVARGWAVDRPSATQALIDRIAGMEPGVDAVWLWGAGGEGKSTVLAYVARHFARQDDVDVLWGDGFLAEDSLTIPEAWVDRRGRGHLTVIVADDCWRLDSVARLSVVEAALRESGGRVFLLLSSRGVGRARNPSLRRAVGRIARGEPELMLGPLATGEIQAIVDRLVALGQLHTYTEDEAVVMLTRPGAFRPDDRPWLLPVLMQLTDPAGRGFDRILEDVLLALTEKDLTPALKVLIAVAVCQASGSALPTTFAEHVLAGHGTLADTLEVLAGEIAEVLGVPIAQGALSQQSGTAAYGDRLYVHHDVIAEGLAGAAHRRVGAHYEEAVLAIPGGAKIHVDLEWLMPKPLFDMLDHVEKWLIAQKQFVVVEQYLMAWIAIDDRRFVNWHRLGACYSDHLLEAVRRQAPRAELIRLTRAGSQAFDLSLKTAQRVLERDDTPRPYRAYTVAIQRRVNFAALATLCGRAGKELSIQALLARSALLATLSLGPDIVTPDARRQNAISTGTLAEGMFFLGELGGAATAWAASRALGGDPSADIKSALAESGTAISPSDALRLPATLDELRSTVFVEAYNKAPVYRDPGIHAKALDAAITAVSRWWAQACAA